MKDWTADIAANRGKRNYTRTELLRRVAWAFGCVLFRLSPRPFFGYRRGLLRMFGSKIGSDVNIYPSVRIRMPWNVEFGTMAAVGDDVLLYSLGKITIGARATVSHGAHLCAGTHDYRDPALPLLRPPIVIGDDVWICADAFIGPGVNVGTGAVIGARAVVTKDVEAFVVVAGNPGRVIGSRLKGSPRESA